MAPSSSTVSPTATATSSADQSHKRAFPFAALSLLALCIAYILGYLIYHRILKSWNARQNAEKMQNFPNEFFEKKPRSTFDSLSATLHRTHEMMIIMKDRLASHGLRAYGRARLLEKMQSWRHMCVAALSCMHVLNDFLFQHSFSSSPDGKPLVSPPPVAVVKENASSGPTTTQSHRDVRATFPKRIARAAREKGSRVLSRGRVTEIEADPKLAPVQGPLRPLSILLSRNKEKERVSFNLV
ncbi:hypothetical protein BDR06DRAFT_295949 [Suillus hirtellus]|nr:hypothetical protein BDR06DRAFT_295949 [Suillus hirtellus]